MHSLPRASALFLENPRLTLRDVALSWIALGASRMPFWPLVLQWFLCGHFPGKFILFCLLQIDLVTLGHMFMLKMLEKLQCVGN